MNTDANDISRLNGLRHNLFKRFVDENGIACSWGSGRCQDKEPSWCDYCCPEGIVAWIDQMYVYWEPTFPSSRSPAPSRLPGAFFEAANEMSPHFHWHGSGRHDNTPSTIQKVSKMRQLPGLPEWYWATENRFLFKLRSTVSTRCPACCGWISRLRRVSDALFRATRLTNHGSISEGDFRRE